MKVRNLKRHQDNLIALIKFAETNEYATLPTNPIFVEIFTKGSQGDLTPAELSWLTKKTRNIVHLPVYTTTQAAAWLGVGLDTIRSAIWKSNPPKLRHFKPGHDVLISAGALWAYLENN